MNKAIVAGALGKDPELTYTQGGTPVCKLSVATSKRGKDGKSQTTWHNIVVWGKPAETAAKFLEKGRKVLVEGEMVHRDYTTKDGVRRWSFEIHTWNHIEFMGEQARNDSVKAADDGLGSWTPTSSIDDIPF